MITCAGDIKQGGAWNGKTGLEKHLDSSMDFAEHQRIAWDALKLLAGTMAVADNPAGKKLEQLKEAYDGNDASDVLYISKGIHQPTTNPHIQLQLKRSQGRSYTFHLNVSTSSAVIQGLPEDYFHWVGVQFAADVDLVPDGKVYAFWPLVATIDRKNRHNRRRWSISPGEVQGTIDTIERQRQEEQERANRVEQARIAESNRAKTRNLIAEQLGKQNWTIPGNKTNGMNKLIDGEKVAVNTKTGKTINVMFDNGKVKQAAT